LDPQITGSKTGKKTQIALNSNDKLFTNIRDLNFSVLGNYLNKKAKEIEEYYNVSSGSSAKIYSTLATT
jgi:hypothetical protein